MPTPAQRNTTIHGVSIHQTQLQGKWYTPVDARVKIAEQANPALIRREDAGYHVVSVQFIQIADRWAYHCMVEYPAGSGVVKPGTDFIDTKDPSGVAKAETSAIGRALGLHGIAVEESIASLEEMRHVAPTFTPEQDEDTRTVEPRVERRQLPAQPTPKSAPAPTSTSLVAPATRASEQQVVTIAKLAQALQRQTPDTSEMTYAQAREMIAALSQVYQAQRRPASVASSSAQKGA